MELYLKNVPPTLAEHDLIAELDSSMKTLNIVDWACDKPRRKNMAWLAFLNPADGAKFFDTHGKIAPTGHQPAVKKGKAPFGQPRARDIARLHITRVPIVVEKSTRAVSKEMLGHMKHKQGVRAARADAPVTVPERNPNLPFITTYIRMVACGMNVFDGSKNQLTYAMHTSKNTFCTVRVTQRAVNVMATGLFRFDIPTETIQDFIVSYNSRTVTLVLAEPPRFFGPSAPSKENNFAEWTRQLSCPNWASHHRYAAHCLVYQLWLSESFFEDFVKSLKERDYISVTNDDLPMLNSPKPYVHDLRTSLDVFEGTMQKLGKQKIMPFSILFQLEALVRNNYLHPSSGSRMATAMARLAQDAKQENSPVPFTIESMKKLFPEIPYPCTGTEPEELDVDLLVDRVVQIEAGLRKDNPIRHHEYGTVISGHQAWVMKVMITPTRIVLHGPEAESRNRILRKFPHHTDHFIRCLFCDDDGQDVSFNPKVSNDIVYERFRNVLSSGVSIAGRHFNFLGFSHSSLRSHSAWFMASFVDDNFQMQSNDTVIKGLGKFEDIRVPAKCAARIGQAFSETPYAVPIFNKGISVRFIPDVTNKDGSRVFSDGVGTISKEAMEEFWAHLPQRSNSATCFQIRWSGAKGMLSLDTRLKGKEFNIRKDSMMKFVSDDVMDLGVCDSASRPLRLWLNRQMIKILEDMGTEDKWFMDLQNKELKVLRAITAQAVNTSTFLRHQLIGTAMGLPGFIMALDRLNLDFRRDEFLKTVVEHVVLRELRLLKHKARIPVDQGVTLFGIMDETGYLEEDEIYVTFDRSHDRIASLPRIGPALVTRSPALHPGDIRVVKMVTPPKNSPLRHLRNCIVFSQHGDRDLPSQLSGGDLDGDLYSVIWDLDAMPKRMFTPADYPRVPAQPLDRDVTRDDIADFFINFMQTDVLGVIATRHQILADLNDGGTMHGDCLKLAELHSTAVDSSKTGIPVNLRELPKAPKARPDFLAPAPPLKLYDLGQVGHIMEDEENEENDDMGVAKHKYYRSERILGKLYRSVDESKIWREDIHRPQPEKGRGDRSLWVDFFATTAVRELLAKGGPSSCNYGRRTKQAWKIRNLYESAVGDMMWQFSDNPRRKITEVEVFCGFILNKRGGQTRRQRDSSIKLREDMDQLIDWLVKLIREPGPVDAEAEADQANGEVKDEQGRDYEDEDVLELCLACLVVGCMRDPKRDGAYHGTGELQSFKLVAASCLVKEMTYHGMLSPLRNEGGGYLGVNGGAYDSVTLPLR